MLLEPKMRENCVVIWLGGHDIHFPMGASEFNMKQDIAAARIVMGSGMPFVQLPCRGVVDRFLTSKQELAYWLLGKNALCDYLYENTVAEAESYAAGKPWTRVIWDVTAVAWLLNDGQRFMRCRTVRCPMPMHDKTYAPVPYDHEIGYVYYVDRDALFEDLFRKLGGAV
jgi:inosine-uridine nucleoside N-ribohydrolase